MSPNPDFHKALTLLFTNAPEDQIGLQVTRDEWVYIENIYEEIISNSSSWWNNNKDLLGYNCDEKDLIYTIQPLGKNRYICW